MRVTRSTVRWLCGMRGPRPADVPFRLVLSVSAVVGSRGDFDAATPSTARRRAWLGATCFGIRLSGLSLLDPQCALPFKMRSEEHTSELQSRPHLVCRPLLGQSNI